MASDPVLVETHPQNVFITDILNSFRLSCLKLEGTPSSYLFCSSLEWGPRKTRGWALCNVVWSPRNQTITTMLHAWRPITLSHTHPYCLMMAMLCISIFWVYTIYLLIQIYMYMCFCKLETQTSPNNCTLNPNFPLFVLILDNSLAQSLCFDADRVTQCRA